MDKFAALFSLSDTEQKVVDEPDSFLLEVFLDHTPDMLSVYS